MKNLELKVRLPNPTEVQTIIKQYFIEILDQTDTYFRVTNGRLKLREEVGKEAFMIQYQRPDTATEKVSEYHLYPIPDVIQFWQIFGPTLQVEVVVKKIRHLYLYENARIHIDTVDDLGSFLEIEVVINNEEQHFAQQNDPKVLPQAEPKKEKTASAVMEYLVNLMKITDCEKIKCGYRELLISVPNKQKTLDYYAKADKIYWFVNEDVNEKIKRNSVVPCIFVERLSGGAMNIVQLEETIKFDNYKYTAWRKLLGETYGVYVDVLLIFDNELYTLDNRKIKFEDLGRSQIQISKDQLAKFSLITNSDDQ